MGALERLDLKFGTTCTRINNLQTSVEFQLPSSKYLLTKN